MPIETSYRDDDNSLKELAAYAELAKTMVSLAIRDLTSKNMENADSARYWLFGSQCGDDDQGPAAISFNECCETITASMRTLGYDYEITPALIRQKVMASNDGRKKMISSLESKYTGDLYQQEFPFKNDLEIISFFGNNDDFDEVGDGENDVSHDHYSDDGDYFSVVDLPKTTNNYLNQEC